MKAQTVEVMTRFLEIVARTAYDTKKPGTAFCDVKVDDDDVADEIISAIESSEGGIQSLIEILELGKALKRYAKINLSDIIDEEPHADDWDFDERED